MIAGTFGIIRTLHETLKMNLPGPFVWPAACRAGTLRRRGTGSRSSKSGDPWSSTGFNAPSAKRLREREVRLGLYYLVVN